MGSNEHLFFTSSRDPTPLRSQSLQQPTTLLTKVHLHLNVIRISSQPSHDADPPPERSNKYSFVPEDAADLPWDEIPSDSEYDSVSDSEEDSCSSDHEYEVARNRQLLLELEDEEELEYELDRTHHEHLEAACSSHLSVLAG